ncbi:hypothetical protein [Thermosulfurimonas marina]|uniref:hypothetical protein n=1 Tax=Thermosulfurimonas marina TaxID=2047767 RepID=UPI001B302A3C|nr:hypothetical protein [Thermosulfurimonas marina]
MWIVLAFVLSGCATILSGKTQKINVTSTGKTGVKFEIDGQTYSTPAIVTLERENKDKIIKILDPECTQKQYLLNKKINPVFFVNLLSGGVFGSTTDYVSNAMWQYDSNVNIQCK